MLFCLIIFSDDGRLSSYAAILDDRLLSLEWILFNRWHWTFILDNAIETLSAMSEDLLAWVDFFKSRSHATFNWYGR